MRPTWIRILLHNSQILKFFKQTYKVSPKKFKLIDGKLYLFFNDYYKGKPFNTIVPWNSAEKEMIAKADKNWHSQK